ncbi:uncharacterized protein LOC105220599 [Zeugodacus cucurbitae]|uniref:uncharacterized protein LOC105220599 n=1 Tax=Zeugodacus cucurbitae TaxID=28588 RepID=UPI0023D9423E|nr:uncharacterized protein LOC105220599 [Zeugodacus cucurbitae]
MRTKFERTTQEQLQHFIMFCKHHPELQRGKRTTTNPQGLQMLWSELADTLNSLRGRTRTAAMWRESLMHWKHQLRSRARKIKAHAEGTCGGPPSQAISEFEEQASGTFGAAAVNELPVMWVLDHQLKLLPHYLWHLVQVPPQQPHRLLQLAPINHR